eukprot:2561211-Alexandrium_andersonii.AAC.1
MSAQWMGCVGARAGGCEDEVCGCAFRKGACARQLYARSQDNACKCRLKPQACTITRIGRRVQA